MGESQYALKPPAPTIEGTYEVQKIAKAMIRHGGGFVHYLGEALTRADPDNTERIKNAFPEYWQKYLKMSEVE